ncbi:Thiosulfate sulfurtransferase rdl2, mitochondrial, partial [Coemansia sp. RSA 1933]
AFITIRLAISYLSRSMSSQAKPVSLADIQTISTDAKHDGRNMVILDVRRPAEYEAGHVPNAINLQVDELQEALKLPKDQFKKSYNFDLPSPDSDTEGVVVYCGGGGRAARAA